MKRSVYRWGIVLCVGIGLLLLTGNPSTEDYRILNILGLPAVLVAYRLRLPAFERLAKTQPSRSEVIQILISVMVFCSIYLAVVAITGWPSEHVVGAILLISAGLLLVTPFDAADLQSEGEDHGG